MAYENLNPALIAIFQIYTARRNMLERQTLRRVLQPQYGVLPAHYYKMKNSSKEGIINFK